MTFSDDWREGPPAVFHCRGLKHLNRAVVYLQYASSADFTRTNGTLSILLIPKE